jgi:hypothetical protein
MKKTIKLTQRTIMNYIKQMMKYGHSQIFLTFYNGVMATSNVQGDILLQGEQLVDMLRISCQRHGADDDAQIFLHSDGTQEYFSSVTAEPVNDKNGH